MHERYPDEVKKLLQSLKESSHTEANEKLLSLQSDAMQDELNCLIDKIQRSNTLNNSGIKRYGTYNQIANQIKAVVLPQLLILLPLYVSGNLYKKKSQTSDVKDDDSDDDDDDNNVNDDDDLFEIGFIEN